MLNVFTSDDANEDIDCLMLAYSQQPYIQKHFGMFARTITYKKMTIVYNVLNGVAYVRRVIPSKMIY